MAKYLALISGVNTEVSGLTTSAGAGDAGKIPQLDSSGRLDQTLMPVGIGAETASVIASEALTAGNLVNIWSNAGTPNVRKADASNGRIAHGFVLANVSASANATVYFEGTVTGLTGLTPGARQFLSATTPGLTTESVPATAGQYVQRVGTAASTTSFTFNPLDEVLLA